MKKKLFAGLMTGLFLVGMIAANVEAATITFYDNRVIFESQLSSCSTIDFEGEPITEAYPNTVHLRLDFLFSLWYPCSTQ